MTDFYKLDRTIMYRDTVYQIIEVLSSNLLLVIDKATFDKGEFPLQPLVIPGK